MLIPIRPDDATTRSPDTGRLRHQRAPSRGPYQWTPDQLLSPDSGGLPHQRAACLVSRQKGKVRAASTARLCRVYRLLQSSLPQSLHTSLVKHIGWTAVHQFRCALKCALTCLRAALLLCKAHPAELQHAYISEGRGCSTVAGVRAVRS
jgi:hypothetical protein